MSLVDDLKAAKALIDTPDKWAGEGGYEGSILHAITISTTGRQAYEAAKAALVKQMEKRWRLPPSEYDSITAFGKAAAHADVMSLFDSAIEASK